MLLNNPSCIFITYIRGSCQSDFIHHTNHLIDSIILFKHEDETPLNHTIRIINISWRYGKYVCKQSTTCVYCFRQSLTIYMRPISHDYALKLCRGELACVFVSFRHCFCSRMLLENTNVKYSHPRFGWNLGLGVAFPFSQSY